MIRTISVAIYLLFLLLGTIPSLIRVRKFEKENKIKEKYELVHRVAHNFGKKMIDCTGSKIRVTGYENIPKDETVVFIGNHQGNFDIPLLLGYIDKPIAYIAKIEIMKLPIVREWMKYMRCVFIDRKDPRQSLKAISQGVEHIKEGQSMVIFPEGTRSKGDKVGEFKPGSLKLATKAGTTIVPFTIKGTYKIFEANGNKIKPAEVELIIHPPVSTNGLSKEEINELPDKIKEIITSPLK